jgi:hypothetical protein
MTCERPNGNALESREVDQPSDAGQCGSLEEHVSAQELRWNIRPVWPEVIVTEVWRLRAGEEPLRILHPIGLGQLAFVEPELAHRSESGVPGARTGWCRFGHRQHDPVRPYHGGEAIGVVEEGTHRCVSILLSDGAGDPVGGVDGIRPDSVHRDDSMTGVEQKSLERVDGRDARAAFDCGNVGLARVGARGEVLLPDAGRKPSGTEQGRRGLRPDPSHSASYL